MENKMITKFDKKNRFISMFAPQTGFYARSGVFDENGNDTGVDPFMSSYPELLDIGIMQTCVCAHKCNVDCYQKAIDRVGNNMSLKDFTKIIEQCKGKMFQCALGGAGDVDTHESFEEILKVCRQYDIVPNFTTSGITMTKEKAEICKKYCGAVAVSEHFADYTNNAVKLLLDAGVKTNIHYVLSNKTIDAAIEKLENDSFTKGINAVIFLLYKPVGLGVEENMLNANDERVKKFFKLIDTGSFHHKIGFDSCSCSGIVNFTKNIDKCSLDYCEGGRFSAYIDANMHMMPCSFANQNPNWFIDLHEHTIQEVWDSELFEKFRHSLSHSCAGCKDRLSCGGGCPLVNQITLCNRDERDFQEGE
jgi:radical SAM protein with 4Fe4S-binding SPASM domain